MTVKSYGKRPKHIKHTNLLVIGLIFLCQISRKVKRFRADQLAPQTLPVLITFIWGQSLMSTSTSNI